MFNSEKDILCACGKKKGNMNSTNWARHLTSCKTMTFKSKNTSILSFVKRPAATSTESLQSKKQRSGK